MSFWLRQIGCGLSQNETKCVTEQHLQSLLYG